MNTYEVEELKTIEQSSAQFVAATWFNTVGIVLTQDQVTFEYKAYIKDIYKTNGPAGYYDKGTEKGDILDIMAWGTTFPMDAAKILFPWIQLDSTKNWKEANPGFIL